MHVCEVQKAARAQKLRNNLSPSRKVWKPPQHTNRSKDDIEVASEDGLQRQYVCTDKGGG